MSQRFRLAYSWRLAALLTSRHPHLRIVETHPGGGQYDCLTLLNGSNAVIDINRAGSIHVHAAAAAPRPLELLFTLEEPFDLVRDLERDAGLKAVRTAPPATPRTLAYRVAAEVAAASVVSRQPIDVRSEFLDSSGMGGSGRRYLLDNFPLAITQAREMASDVVGEPWSQFWLMLRGDEPRAALDTEGRLYHGSAQVDLSSAYAAHGRSVLRLLAATAPQLLP